MPLIIIPPFRTISLTVPPDGHWDFSNISTLWKDTAGTIPVTTAGDQIARVDDISGSGYHANTPIGSGTNRLFATNVQNAKSAIHFHPGATVSPTNAALVAGALPTTAQPNTIFSVFSFPAGITGGSSAIYDGESGFRHGLVRKVNSNHLRIIGPSSTVADALNATSSTGVWNYTGVEFNSSSSAVYQNGSLTDSGLNIGTGSIKQLILGNNSVFNAGMEFYLGEVLFYNRLLTSTERNAVHNYLGAKWGL